MADRVIMSRPWVMGQDNPKTSDTSWGGDQLWGLEKSCILRRPVFSLFTSSPHPATYPILVPYLWVAPDRENQQGTNQRQRATTDLTMVAFYYLLRVGEYTVKGSRNNTKQTVQFKYEDVTFFKRTTVASSVASRRMLLRISSHLPMGSH